MKPNGTIWRYAASVEAENKILKNELSAYRAESLTFSSEVAERLSVEMGDESSFFLWTKNEHEQITFTRNTQ